MDNMENTAQQQLPAKTSGLAIASLILGICSFCTLGIGGVIGLVLGICALSAIRKQPGRLKGNGLAIAGIIVSCVSFLFVIAQLMAILMPALFRVKTQAKTIVSSNNLRQLSMAAMIYSEENDYKLPPSESWPEVLRPYCSNMDALLKSPFDPDAGWAYAMNANLDGLKLSDIEKPAYVVLFFECRFGSPAGGGRELLPEEPRSRRGYQIAFLDGHVECVRQERLDELIWEP